jgi:hypothetical protein
MCSITPSRNRSSDSACWRNSLATATVSAQVRCIRSSTVWKGKATFVQPLTIASPPEGLPCHATRTRRTGIRQEQSPRIVRGIDRRRVSGERRRAMIVPMDINRMLAELKGEHAGVERAILLLERLASGQSKRRGRPPKWMTQVKSRGRPPGSKNKPKDE